MLLAGWIALLGGATFTGALVVAAMALPRRLDLAALAASFLALAASVAGLVGVPTRRCARPRGPRA